MHGMPAIKRLRTCSNRCHAVRSSSVEGSHKEGKASSTRARLRERLAVLVQAARALPVDAQRAGPAGGQRAAVLHAAHQPRDYHAARVAAALLAGLPPRARPAPITVISHLQHMEIPYY